MSSTPQTDSPKGLAYAVAAYGLWGFLPIYMKALAHLPAAEIIAHRIVWSLPIAAAVLLWQGRAAEVGQALRQPRLLAMAAITRWTRRLAITSTRCSACFWARRCWGNG